MSNTTIDSKQQQHAIEIMQQYLAAPAGPDGLTPKDAQAERDQSRRLLIDQELRPLTLSYLTGSTPLADFKSKIDGINKRNEHWGFKGIKGQMFFNMIVNTATDLAECDHELKAAIAVPTSDDMARSRLRAFVNYATRLGDEHVRGGGAGHGRPKVGSVPFFLSYFWQLQDRDVWPVYYTNSVQTMEDLNLWRATEDLAENYISFKRLHQELAVLFTKASGQPFHLYDVEHVFWFKGGNPYEGSKSTELDGRPQPVKPPAPPILVRDNRLPDSYVPPIVAILPQISVNDPALAEAARLSGTSLERAFEKNINAAFTMLGFQTQLLGQGQGRVPDGIAIDPDHSYALIWDGKVRADKYSMGTDDRTIREYIQNQSRDLKRRRALRNLYYVIISSRFADDCDDTIRDLKMNTDINEVCLMEAGALVAIVDQKLRDPTQISLGPDGVQRLFSTSGILTEADINNLVA